MFSREKQETIRAAIEDQTIESVENSHGSCVVEDKDGDEFSYKWRNGETTVEGEDGVSYVFRVRVELVAVES